MSLKNVKPSLNKISKSLESTHASREYLIKNGRDVIMLCSQAIISVHKGDIKSAKNKMNQAKSQLSKLRKHATGGLRYHIITPEQEFVETVSLLSIIEKKPIPPVKSLQVSNEAYLLGLLDCIGELKRLVFDKIRSGKGTEAVKIFEIMENLYLNLYPFSTFDKIVKETRRKLDVNRFLIEETRAAITEEIRRSDLISELKKNKK